MTYLTRRRTWIPCRPSRTFSVKWRVVVVQTLKKMIWMTSLVLSTKAALSQPRPCPRTPPHKMPTSSTRTTFWWRWETEVAKEPGAVARAHPSLSGSQPRPPASTKSSPRPLTRAARIPEASLAWHRIRRRPPPSKTLRPPPTTANKARSALRMRWRAAI